MQSTKWRSGLKPGEIVPVEIAFFPISRIWHKGQKLRLQIAGRYFREGWFEPFSWDTDNKGSTSSTLAASTTRFCRYRSFRPNTGPATMYIGSRRRTERIGQC